MRDRASKAPPSRDVLALATASSRPDDAVSRRPESKLLAPLAPREKVLLIYALAVYAKLANGGLPVTSTLISRMLDSDQLAEINDLVLRRLELEAAPRPLETDTRATKAYDMQGFSKSG